MTSLEKIQRFRDIFEAIDLEKINNNFEKFKDAVLGNITELEAIIIKEEKKVVCNCCGNDADIDNVICIKCADAR